MFPFSLCCTDDNLSIRGKSIYKLNKMTWYPSVPEFIKLFKHEGDWLVGPGLPRASVIRSAKDLFFADWSFKLIEVPHLWFCPFRGVFFFFFLARQKFHTGRLKVCVCLSVNFLAGVSERVFNGLGGWSDAEIYLCIHWIFKYVLYNQIKGTAVCLLTPELCL